MDAGEDQHDHHTELRHDSDGWAVYVEGRRKAGTYDSPDEAADAALQIIRGVSGGVRWEKPVGSRQRLIDKAQRGKLADD